MLTSVEAYNARGETLALPLEDISDGFLIKDFDGLDPVKANIVSSRYAQRDGSAYQTSSRENRNVTLSVGLEPDYIQSTVQSLRARLYDFFMPKTFVRLRFYFDEVEYAHISGRVETCETQHFSEDPEVKISIVCFDPDFVSPLDSQVNANTVTNTTETPVEYLGTTDTGLLFVTSIKASIPGFTIYNRAPTGELFEFEFVGPLLANDFVTISTVPGNKFITRRRNGVDSSILYGVSPASSWLSLSKGTNYIRVVTASAGMPWQINHDTRYGGL